ncbi:TPA: transposase, partial [Escherichia coli]|nr:transposase [Escherichia coli]
MQKYKINRSRHAAFLLHVHLVFVTKYRRKILGELHCAAFHQYAAEVCRDFGA